MTRKFWEESAGSKICGGYLLRELIASTETTAVYRTNYGEERALIKLLPAEEATHEVRPLDHPHITRVFAGGPCKLGRSGFHYSVTEEADENLGTVIASRALSPDETREMLRPVLEALAYLHDQGLAHGQIQPSNILAKGDSIKLSADPVRPAGAIASPAEDMKALGLTIIEVLTRERQPSALPHLPQPFRDIVEHLLQVDPSQRWTARQTAMRLSGTVPESGPPAAEPAGPAGRKQRPVPVWVYPVGAALVIGVLIILTRVAGSSSEPSVAASVSSGTTSGVSAPTAPSPPGPPPVVQKAPPVAQKPSPMPPSPAQKEPSPAAHGWFVVVASYAREADARQEAQNLGRRFPQFKLSVFPPSPIDTHYVVILGSGLSEQGAESLRQRAVSSGLPADTYIKKYQSPK